MFKQALAAAIGVALTTLAVVSAASAAQSGSTGYTFQRQSQMTGAKTHPLVFNCNAMNTMAGDGPAISGKHTGGR